MDKNAETAALDLKPAASTASSVSVEPAAVRRPLPARVSSPVLRRAPVRGVPMPSPTAGAGASRAAALPAPAAPAASTRPAKPVRRGITAHEMAAKQRDISVAEFFQKNRHLLGFDSPRKALLTTVKEAVDNSLDACEEAGILPEVGVQIEVAVNGGPPPASVAQAERFVVTVTDNGPGIVKKNISKVFAKLLYGSKFHRLRMSRGQQGIGISAAGMYGQLTTGKPTRVISKIKGEDTVHVIEMSIDTKRNEPVEHETKQYKWDPEHPPVIELDHHKVTWKSEHGTLVMIELAGRYQKGKASVDEYLELTSIANPHALLTYRNPENEAKTYPRGVAVLPDAPREIKPHPYGIELGMLLKMLQDTTSHWLSGFLSADFVRISAQTAEGICKAADLSPRARPREIVGEEAERLYKALQHTKLMAPPTDCISPIGEQAILAGLVKTIKADFYTAATRPPKVYRGNPFAIEVGLAFGKGDGAARKDAAQLAAEELEKQARGEPVEAKAEGEEDEDSTELAQVIRFANRVPLIYQQSACAMYKAVLRTSWRNYGLSQSKGAPPQGPMVIFLHMGSVWVPFTSEAKEAVAEYDEIVDEAKRAIQECGRRLGVWLRKREHAKTEFERRNTFQRYIEEVAESCKRLKSGKLDAERLKKQLTRIAEKVTGGEETDALLNRKKAESAEEALEHTVVRTEAGLEGEVPELMAPPPVVEAPPAEGAVVAAPAPAQEVAVRATEPVAKNGVKAPAAKNGKTAPVPARAEKNGAARGAKPAAAKPSAPAAPAPPGPAEMRRPTAAEIRAQVANVPITKLRTAELIVGATEKSRRKAAVKALLAPRGAKKAQAQKGRGKDKGLFDG